MAAVLQGTVPPLTERQAIMLADTDDGSSTVDASGFYALLENTGTWPDDPRQVEPGCRLIDYEALRRDPEAWRGEPVILEGSLASIANAAMYSPGRLLSHEGWRDLVVWHLRGSHDVIYIIALTAPPSIPTGPAIQGHRVPIDPAREYRIVGRFYKLITVSNQDGEPRRYPVFVGHGARTFDTTGASARGPAGSSSLGVAAAVLMVLLFAGAYRVIRSSLKRRGAPTREGARGDGADDTRSSTYRTDLPRDPAAALDALQHEHEASADTDANKQGGS